MASDSVSSSSSGKRRSESDVSTICGSDDSFATSSGSDSETSTLPPPCKSARVGSPCESLMPVVAPRRLEALLALKASGEEEELHGDENLATIMGPPDFGGRLAEMLWGVSIEYNSAMEYMMLRFRPTREERERLIGCRRVSFPELWRLARCSHGIRRSIIAAAAARRRTIEPGASQEQRRTCIEICDNLRKRFPKSWTCVGPSLHESIALEAEEWNLPPITIGALA